MSTLSRTGLKRALQSAFLTLALAGSITCSKGTEVTLPLLVVAGPDNLISLEVRAPEGEIIWRLEAETPAEVRSVIYPVVPAGFRQAIPESEPPRPLRVGEDLVIESRAPDRVFLHRAFARSESTVTILASEMRRTESEGQVPSTPR